MTRPTKHEPLKRAVSARTAKPTEGADNRISWDSPDLVPMLDKRIAKAWGDWSSAVDMAPLLEDAPVVARILEALLEARALRNPEALDLIDKGARRALERMDPAIAQRTYDRYVADGHELAPGVTPDDFRSFDPNRGIGRNSDRRLALDKVAARMDSYLSRPLRPVPQPPLTPDKMARGFLVAIAHAEPLSNELKRLGIIKVGTLAQHQDAAAHRAVTSVFTKMLDPQQRMDLDTAPTGAQMVKAALIALKYPAADSLFEHDRKRRARAPR